MQDLPPKVLYYLFEQNDSSLKLVTLESDPISTRDFRNSGNRGTSPIIPDVSLAHLILP